jgi:hypothetical protein
LHVAFIAPKLIIASMRSDVIYLRCCCDSADIHACAAQRVLHEKLLADFLPCSIIAALVPRAALVGVIAEKFSRMLFAFGRAAY